MVCLPAGNVYSITGYKRSHPQFCEEAVSVLCVSQDTNTNFFAGDLNSEAQFVQNLFLLFGSTSNMCT